MDFDYDVFISYSSHDREWAEKLYERLRSANLKIFFDRERLEAGKSWEWQLQDALRQSRHLVAVWSRHAYASPWVQREIYTFDVLVNSSPGAAATSGRRLIVLQLEDANPALASTQQVTDLNLPGLYDRGAAAVDPDVWQRATQKVVDAVRSDDKRTPVPLVVLAMTADELAAIPADDTSLFDLSFAEILVSLGICAPDASDPKAPLRGKYGARRVDWTPFLGDTPISGALAAFEDDVNKGAEIQFRWESVSDAFWTNTTEAKRERDRILDGPFLIVIDPLSLYCPRVKARLDLLSDCSETDHGIILVMNPSPSMPPGLADLRRLLEDGCTPVFDSYFKPPIPLKKYIANCGAPVRDLYEALRLVRASLGRHAFGSRPSSPPPFLGVGS